MSETLPQPSAKNVTEALLRQQDPANWTPEIWAAHEADLKELRQLKSVGPYHADGALCVGPCDWQKHSHTFRLVKKDVIEEHRQA